MKQNPFSLYDFMGYFIPGATVLYLLEIVSIVQENTIVDLEKVVTSFPSVGIEAILIFLIFSYILGHILSYVSSITVEKYAVWKYGYPSKYLLNITQKSFWHSDSKFYFVFWRFFLILLLFPTVVFDYFLGQWFGLKKFYSSKLDPTLVKLIRQKVKILLKSIGMTSNNGFDDVCEINVDFNRIILHYTYENSKNHQQRLENYVAIFGFLRTFNLISNLLFWYLIGYTIFSDSYGNSLFTIILIVSIVSYLFFMAFMKFYRRYTLEGLMIIAVDKEL
ncbi:MAG: hypothetical protein R6U66_08080 [Bacteroidales bacterium]